MLTSAPFSVPRLDRGGAAAGAGATVSASTGACTPSGRPFQRQGGVAVPASTSRARVTMRSAETSIARSNAGPNGCVTGAVCSRATGASNWSNAISFIAWPSSAPTPIIGQPSSTTSR